MPALEHSLVSKVLARFPDVTFADLIGMLKFDEGERPQGIEVRRQYRNWTNARLARQLQAHVEQERASHQAPPYRRMG